jgi:hypothetical protein
MYSHIVSGLLHRSLISDVLDLSKIEAGRMEIESIPFDIREEVDSILSLFEEKVHQKRLEVSALVHDCVPAWIYGDPGRFRQVLINLVGNAIKVCPGCQLQACYQAMNIDRISDTHQLRGLMLESTTTSTSALSNHNPVFLLMSFLLPCTFGNKLLMGTVGVSGFLLQFTKQGSIFLCIRLVDTSGYDSASTPPSQLLDLVDSKHRKIGSELPALSMEAIDLETEALDDSFTAIHVNGRVDKGVPGVTSKRLRLRRLTQMAPPRLSMKPGPLSSKACVVKWREWKSISTLEADEVCVLISIEDTGVFQAFLYKPEDM